MPSTHDERPRPEWEDEDFDPDDETEFWLSVPGIRKDLAEAKADIEAGRAIKSRNELLAAIRVEDREVVDRLAES